MATSSLATQQDFAGQDFEPTFDSSTMRSLEEHAQSFDVVRRMMLAVLTKYRRELIDAAIKDIATTMSIYEELGAYENLVKAQLDFIESARTRLLCAASAAIEQCPELAEREVSA